ncbi:hypothetical protein IKE67_03300, partial [bacterium]|nr:hypothetical protein [bacterium]
SMNFPNIWTLVGNNYESLKGFAIMLTLAICLAGIYTVINGIKKFETNEQIINTCCWFLWTCLIFLPGMHERYAYPLDILLLLLCFTDKKYIKYSIICILSSLMVYGNFLYSNQIQCNYLAIFYILTYIHFTHTILKDNTNKSEKSNDFEH